ncbi:DUF2087 domain-containing protein [Bacillus sp. Marseille-Q3570]|uniref:DUF2087 domain-containing protein n=1 Tax=Bacillus sp. Marseille-Q3570 TaxID=2963522 RepID=UPI0021B7538C|nr:DUF2087 domain-containing protein [Bacillus sp. Marseille-Q3570]
MNDRDLFWDAETDELKKGYIFNQTTEEFTCLICRKRFQKGLIFPWAEGLYMDAERAIKQHIIDEHGSMLEYLLSMNKKYTGLTDVQRKILMSFKSGQSDKEIAKQLDIGSTSTIRTHRFKLKEKEKQAKVFLAIMEMLKKADQKDDLVQIHKGATQVDERYAITTKEREKVLSTYFKKGPDGPITHFPSKEKRKIIVLQHIIRKFDPERVYTEMEVNEVLKPVIDDYVTVRRYLIEYGFLDRNKDCSEYWVKK